jgi:membrane-associated HD superfamily phosphohydrolase
MNHIEIRSNDTYDDFTTMFEEDEMETRIVLEKALSEKYFEDLKVGRIGHVSCTDENDDSDFEDPEEVEKREKEMEKRLNEQFLIDREFWYMNDEEKMEYFTWLRAVKKEIEHHDKIEQELNEQKSNDEHNKEYENDLEMNEYLIEKASRKFMYH